MLWLLALPSLAADLLSPIPVLRRGEGFVETTGGEHLEGELYGFVLSGGQLSLTLRDDLGTKRKLSADEISEISLFSAPHAQRVLWREVRVPGGVPRLLPLLNPGLDTLVAIYPDPTPRMKRSEVALLAVRADVLDPVLLTSETLEEQWESVFGLCGGMPPQAPSLGALSTYLRDQEARCGAP